MSKKLFITATPAFLIMAWLIRYRIWLVSHSNQSIIFGIFLYFGMVYIIGLSAAFLTNLILPVSVNRKVAIQSAMPSMFSYLLFFVINDLTITIVNPSLLSFEDITFGVLSYLVIYIPTGFLLLIIVAFFGWLGAHIKSSQHQS